MKTWYYEVSEYVPEFGHRHFFVRSDKASDAMEAGGYELTQCSDRIWLEEDDRVKWIKNRYLPLTDFYAVVDHKEFMWVKLSAKEHVKV